VNGFSLTHIIQMIKTQAKINPVLQNFSFWKD